MDLRKIDALVAEHIFDYEVDHQSGSWDESDRWYLRGQGIRGSDGNYYPTRLPSYSSDIAAAWEVIDKLIANHKGVSGYREFFALDKEEGKWEAGMKFSYYDGDHFVESASAKATTAPLAICLAALKAVGVKVSE